jgi:hypothetical protein
MNPIQAETTILYRTKTVFPFEFFPTEIVVNPHKITIINQTFFFSTTTKTIMIADIATVELSTSLLLASITLYDRQPEVPFIRISNLTKSNAAELRRVIQGLIVMYQNKMPINLAKPTELTNQASTLGQSQAISV